RTNRPGPSDLRSDRVRGIRASSIRWNLAGLLGRGPESVRGPVPEGSRCPGPPRTDRWLVSRRPTGTRRPPRHAPVGTLRNRGSAAAAFVPSLFPVPAEHRQLPPAQLRTARSAPPRGREAPVGDPGVSAGPPTDDGSKARGHVLRDRGDGRERDARRLRTGTPGPSSGRVLPRPGRRRADERGRNVPLKHLVESLTTTYKPRIKTDFALGPRKYARMIFAEHLAAIPLDRLTAVGQGDLRANQVAFGETAKKIDPAKPATEVLERMERDHPTADRLIEDTRRMLEEIRSYLIDHDIVTVPSEERAKVIETPRFYRFATAAMNPPGSFERAAKDAFYYVTPVEESWTPE